MMRHNINQPLPSYFDPHVHMCIRQQNCIAFDQYELWAIQFVCCDGNGSMQSFLIVAKAFMNVYTESFNSVRVLQL